MEQSSSRKFAVHRRHLSHGTSVTYTEPPFARASPHPASHHACGSYIVGGGDGEGGGAAAAMVSGMKRHVVALQYASATNESYGSPIAHTPSASPPPQSHSSPRSVSTTPLPQIDLPTVSRNRHVYVGNCRSSVAAEHRENCENLPAASGRYRSSSVRFAMTYPVAEQFTEFPVPSMSMPSCFPR